MSETRLRTMIAADLDVVSEIESRAYVFPWTRGNFNDSLNSGYGCVVLEKAGAVIGYAITMNAVDDLHLLNITVAPEFQGRGLSRNLLGWVQDAARRHQCQGILLEVRPSNQRARSIYEHLGFSAIGVRRGYYPSAAGREDAIVMRKTLRLSSETGFVAGDHAVS